MIEIIPNWHPLLVHFTVGLLSTSVLFYIASACLSQTNAWKQQWLNMANWSLWSGCLFAVATAGAGWLAYNSVAHDSASHAAMTLHRNWALPTASIFLLLGLWAILIARKQRRPSFLFLTFSIIAAGLLMITGWLGAEAVYRYGLGVQSLPVVVEGADGHNHSHGGAGHGKTEEAHQQDMPEGSHAGHEHSTDESHTHGHTEGHQHGMLESEPAAHGEPHSHAKEAFSLEAKPAAHPHAPVSAEMTSSAALANVLQESAHSAQSGNDTQPLEPLHSATEHAHAHEHEHTH